MGRLQSFARRALGIVGRPYASQFADGELAQITLQHWLGALPAYVHVNRANAMKVASVAAARHVIAGTAGRIPLVARKDGARVPAQPSLLVQPERGVPRSTTMTWTYDALFFQSCTWWHVTERDAYGWPAWVEWVPLAKAGLDNEGRLIKVGDTPVRPEDVIRFDSPLGEGFLHNAGKIVQRAIALDLAASKAEDSPIPAVELHDELGVELPQDKIDDLLDKWAAARRTRGVAYTPKGLKVIPHGKPADALIIDGRKTISLDVIREANLPAWAASTAIEGATMTYDNRSLRNWELLDLTLGSYFEAVAGRLAMPDVTPRGWTVEADTDRLTRDDMKTRFEAYQIGKTAGFIDNAWIAAQEGWATVPADTPGGTE
ncbi:phage portal protein [Protaetiibacter larvae]|uniref:Phage portal protein n=1 Tax=Protaetiibacter larvae TaxID=2592654 RepID=A0A5C1Y7K5_9MICO|nr:phage portal protein [Protaetiibacter larvae]QEO08892.1 phage portal protein [Protaetiibacter larvae]